MIGKIRNNLLRRDNSKGSTKHVILSQYQGALLMLKAGIINCDEELWNYQKYENKFWHICYHVLFYADLYLSEDEYSFTPWTHHKKEYQFLGKVPYPPYHKPVVDLSYSKQQILDYYDFISHSLELRIAKTNLDKTSGFFWLPFNKMELQLYNIRHIQHHAAQLIERLREERNISVEWVGFGEKAD